MASMVILATFYACSAVLSLILKGVAGILRAVGVMGKCSGVGADGRGFCRRVLGCL